LRIREGEAAALLWRRSDLCEDDTNSTHRGRMATTHPLEKNDDVDAGEYRKIR
jgi:hypothetical protein